MSPDIAEVSPEAIRWKVSIDVESMGAARAAWRQCERYPLAETDKYQSVVQRYVDGRRWEDTPLFREIYRRRFEQGDTVRGCRTEAELLTQYYRRVDRLFADMRAHGFRRDGDPIPVFVDKDQELLVGNQGNHRLAMAQVLQLPSIVVDRIGRYDDVDEDVDDSTDLTAAVRAIPAMTTEAERRGYYRLARAAVASGAIVELGTWLGAATAYLAAAVRDAGGAATVHTYDRFIWKPTSHDKKAGGPIRTSQLAAFRDNLGDLMTHVTVHRGELRDLKWTGGPVSLLVCDAPKRIPEIAAVLKAFTGALPVGSLLAWQDFAYFPSYDIPAALMRLGDHVEFVEAIYPGTTAVFRVTRPWQATDVSQAALALIHWSADEIEAAWRAWGARLPAPMRPRFACGAAMFLCDIGATARAQDCLRAVIAAHGEAVLPKWRYLMEDRANLMQRRYRPLLEVLASCA